MQISIQTWIQRINDFWSLTFKVQLPRWSRYAEFTKILSQNRRIINYKSTHYLHIAFVVPLMNFAAISLIKNYFEHFLDLSNLFFSLISCCIIVKELITHTHSLHKLSMSHPFIFFIMEKLCLAKARFFVMQENFSFLVKCIYEWPQDPLYCNLILQQLSRLQACRPWGFWSSLGVPGVPWHPQILADQLTLSQPGGADYAQPLALITDFMELHPTFQYTRSN